MSDNDAVLIGSFDIVENIEERTIGSFDINKPGNVQVFPNSKGTYHVMVNGSEGKYIPHAHISRKKGNDICFKLYTAEFFPHKEHPDTDLPDDVIDGLDKFLRAQMGSDTSGSTFWEYAINEYNYNNSIDKRNQWHILRQPDYTRLSSSNNYEYYQIYYQGTDIYSAMIQVAGESSINEVLRAKDFPKLTLLSENNRDKLESIWWTKEGLDILSEEILPLPRFRINPKKCNIISHTYKNCHSLQKLRNSSDISSDTPYQVKLK